MRRILLIVIIVVGLVGVGGYAWQQRRATEQAARAAIRQEIVGHGTIVATVSATGHLAPQQQVGLRFSTGSPLPVTELNVSVGMAVQSGTVLARLDDAELILAVRQAEEALQAAELNLAQLQAPPRPEDLAVAEANLRVARSRVYAASLGNSSESVEIARLSLVLAQNALNQTHRTMDELVKQGRWAEKNALQAQADQQVEAAKIAELRYLAAQQPPGAGPTASAQAAVELAQVALDRLRQGPSGEDLKIAELEVSRTTAALQLARHNLEASRLLAPFPGVVAAVNLRVGELAPAALPAIVLVDVERLHLDVAVDEVDVARVQPGQAVTVTLDALPAMILMGSVKKIAPAAASTGNIVSYQVQLALDPAGEARGVRSGMTATAEIVVAEAQDVVVVPNWAIRRNRETGQAFVGLLENGQVTDVPVELGLRNEISSEVLSGVRPGDVVAVDTAREQIRLLGEQ